MTNTTEYAQAAPASQTAISGYACSPQQRRLWQCSESNVLAFTTRIWRLDGTIDIEKLQASFQAVLEGYPSLRTNLLIPPGLTHPIQVIAQEPVSQWHMLTSAETLAHSVETVLAFLNDLERSGIHLVLARQHENHHLLAIHLPSYCADRKSLDILGKEWTKLYQNGVDDDRPGSKAIPYFQYSEWLQQLAEQDENGAEFWAPCKALGTRPTVVINKSPQIHQVATLNQQDIANLLEKLDISFEALWITLLAIFKARVTQEHRLGLGVEVHSRSFPELESTIGPFERILPLATNYDGALPLDIFARQMQSLLESAQAWQDYFDLEPGSSFPLPDWSIHFERQPEALLAGALKVETRFTQRISEPKALNLMVGHNKHDVSLGLCFDGQSIPAIPAKSLVAMLKALVLGVCEGHLNTKPIGALPLMSLQASRELIRQHQGPHQKAQFQQPFDQLFSQQASICKNQIALTNGSQSLTYAELEQHANQMAHDLLNQGIKPGQKVGIGTNDAMTAIPAMLAVLKTGAAYVMLDLELPIQRLAQMVEDCTLSKILTHPQYTDLFSTSQVSIYCLDRARERRTNAPVPAPTSRSSLDQTAYVVFTSGSTGRPKGVAVQHSNLTNYLNGIVQAIPSLETCQSFGLVSSLAADLGLTMLYPSLLLGATLHLIPRDRLFNGLSFGAYCSEHGLEALKITPSHLRTLMMQPQPERALPQKVLILGGEAFAQPLADTIQNLRADLQVFNHYGPSETCVGVLTHRYRGSHATATVPIGKPIAFNQIYIVNQQMALQPPGLSGELLIGGRSVSQGYLGNPEETERRFINNPLETANVQAPVLYRSGDRVRQLADGNLEFLGRVDRQIKLRGFRIELEEIEKALLNLPQVQQVWVGLNEDSANELHLAAWIVCEHQDPQNIRDALAQQLPEPMIPSQLFFLDALPLTANGKVDQAALKKMEPTGVAAHAPYLAPRSALESVLAIIWQDVLGVEKVGVHDEFFLLGGHSLLLIVVNTRIKELFRKELSTGDLFKARTLEEMANLLLHNSIQSDGLEMVARLLLDIRALTPDQKTDYRQKAIAYFDQPQQPTPPVELVTHEETHQNSFDDLLLLDYFLCLAGHPPAAHQGLTQRPNLSQRPLSFEQQRLWFLDQLEEGRSSAYNNTIALRIRGPLNTQALKRAMQAIEDRHHTLRTTFEIKDGDPVTVLQPPQSTPLTEINLEDMAASDREPFIQQTIQTAATTPFNLKTGPIWRSQLLRIAGDHHIWIIVMHHICSDGWSMTLLEKEIARCYRAFSQDLQPYLPSLPIQYVDYAWWQRQHFQGEALEQCLAYWQKLLGHQTLTPQWPTDHARPKIQTYNGNMLPVKYSNTRRQALLQLAHEEQASLFMVFLSAFSFLQSFYSQQSHVRVGTDLANRGHRETEALFGFFVNQLVFCIDLDHASSLRDLLKNCRDVAVSAYAQSALPFDQMVNHLNLERDLSYSPVFQTKVFLEHRQNDPSQAQAFPGLEMSHAMPENNGAARLDLTLGLWDLAETGIEGWLSYNTDLFEKATCEELVVLLDLVLEQMAKNPNQTCQQLEQTLVAHRQKQAEETQLAQAKKKMKKFKRGQRKKVVIQPKSMATFEPLNHLPQPALLRTELSDFNLISWAQENRETWQKALLESGSLLFRGHGIDNPVSMEQVSTIFIDRLFTNNAEHQPIGHGIQIPVDYAADQYLLWHSENSFNHEWPQKIMFACGTPASEGGQTPLVDNRAVYKRIDPSIRKLFEDKGVMYVRNCNPHLGLDWRTVLKVNQKDQVSARCEELKQIAEWRSEDVLRTIAIRPAVIHHPQTGEPCWFNQAQHWHVSCLDPVTRHSVTQVYDEEDYPRHCYFGDGSPIDDGIMAHILDIYRDLEVSFPWQRGDLLVVDNVLTAHARKPFRGERQIFVAMGDLRAYQAPAATVS